jgi:RNA recognition motif-containing protein
MKQNYSFLDFPTEKEALQALELNNQTINGINLKLNWASHSSEYSCFVGDLDHSIDDDKLQSLFSQFKSLKSAKVVLDHSGNSKNYGFVRFNDEEDQRKAIDEMNGMVIEGSSIKVSVATPKKKHGESPVGSFQNTTVFVGGLNESITEAELAR